MTKNSAEKRAAREYALNHAVSYRRALTEVRAADRHGSQVSEPHVTRLLIEAVEGCGIRHWARVLAWDGATSATIADVGGETFVLSADTVSKALHELLVAEPNLEPLDLDSYHADLVIQHALFGCIIYRTGVRRRPLVAA